MRRALPPRKKPETVARPAAPCRLTLWIAVLALIGAALRLSAPDDRLPRSPDETLYTFHATALAKEGFSGIRRLVVEHENHPAIWGYPPPSRIGYLALRAAMMKLTGVWDESAGVYLSCLASVLTLGLVVFLGLRYFDPWTTLLALALASASLVDLAIARRAWVEGVQVLFAAGSMALAFEVRRRAGAAAWCAAFAAVSAYAVTIKESGALVYAVWLGWLLFLFAREKAWKTVAVLLGCAAASTVFTVWIWSSAVGGWSALTALYQRFSIGYSTVPYGLEFCSGPWYRFVFGAFLVAPLPFALFAIAPVRKRDAITLGMSVLAVVLFIPALLPSSQNYRYIALILPALYLLAGWAVRDLVVYVRARFSSSGGDAATVAACVAVVLNAAAGYQSLASVGRFKDLSVKMVMDALL